jgi:hypothetical protein
MPGSSLGDRFGRCRVFLAGSQVFTAASAACAVSPDVTSLIAARAVQGADGGIATPLNLVLISEATRWPGAAWRSAAGGRSPGSPGYEDLARTVSASACTCTMRTRPPAGTDPHVAALIIHPWVEQIVPLCADNSDGHFPYRVVQIGSRSY